MKTLGFLRIPLQWAGLALVGSCIGDYLCLLVHSRFDQNLLDNLTTGVFTLTAGAVLLFFQNKGPRFLDLTTCPSCKSTRKIDDMSECLICGGLFCGMGSCKATCDCSYETEIESATKKLKFMGHTVPELSVMDEQHPS